MTSLGCSMVCVSTSTKPRQTGRKVTATRRSRGAGSSKMAAQATNTTSSATPRASAQGGAKWTLKRVQSPSRGFLTVPIEWKEKDLEKFLWDGWESIDFGFDRPIHLVGKQQRLSEGTNDRVDLLAVGTSDERFAIELKITAARRGDYTQLTSYMGNLESSGVPADKVRGILVAPAFSQKVLNSAAIEPRITLLQFNRKP